MKNKDEVLQKFYKDLKALDTLGAKLAIAYGKRSNEIGKALVADAVANNNEDVNTGPSITILINHWNKRNLKTVI